jgi:predicted Zn-dependent protease
LVSINEAAASASALKAAAESMRHARLVLERGTEQVAPSVAAAPACDVPIEINWEEGANAFTDGERIVIDRGMLNLASSDEELAAVIGHELAHVLSGHIAAKQTNAIGGGVGGLLLDIAFAAAGVNTGGAFTQAGMQIGAAAYSQDFEREADYVGAYFADAAGYDVAAASQIWRRIGSVDARSLSFAGTHPTTPERFVAITNTAAEIRNKRANAEVMAPSGWTPKHR